MLKQEYINENDETLELIKEKTSGKIYKLNDGRVAKILSYAALFCYDTLGVDIYKKLCDSSILEELNISLPVSAIMSNSVCVGYTMDKRDYKNIKDLENKSLEERIKIHRQINDIVRKSNKLGVIFTDLLSGDNILVDENKNIIIDEIDNAQILNHSSISVSKKLGDQKRIIELPKYYDEKTMLFTSELDKKSLMYLFFKDVLNFDMDENSLSIIEQDINNKKLKKIIESNISDNIMGTYLDEFYNIIEKKYELKNDNDSKKLVKKSK